MCSPRQAGRYAAVSLPGVTVSAFVWDDLPQVQAYRPRFFNLGDADDAATYRRRPWRICAAADHRLVMISSARAPGIGRGALGRGS